MAVAVVVVVVVNMVLINPDCFFKGLLMQCNCPVLMSGTVIGCSELLYEARGLHVARSTSEFLIAWSRLSVSLIKAGELGQGSSSVGS